MARGSGSDTPGGPRRFQPERIFETLNRHDVLYVVIGAFAANLQGWPDATLDVDVTPDREVRNLQRLAAALAEMNSVALDDEGDPLPDWPLDDQHLRMQNRTLVETCYGELDIVMNPAGANGYADLVRDARPYQVAEGVTVLVVSLRRVIESKEVVDRPKDRGVLPRMREILEEQESREREAKDRKEDS